MAPPKRKITPEQEAKNAELQAKIEKAVREYARLASEQGMTHAQIAEKLLKETNYAFGEYEDSKAKNARNAND